MNIKCSLLEIVRKNLFIFFFNFPSQFQVVYQESYSNNNQGYQPEGVIIWW